jgi:hypothetical protein
MTSIESLPLLRVTQGVGIDEDFILALAFYLADGTTPLSLAGIAFVATLSQTGASETLSTTGGEIAISGAASNILTFSVLAAVKASWKSGVYAFDLTAADGTYTKDVFLSSTLTVLEPSPANVNIVGSGGSMTSNVVVPIPPALAGLVNPPINTQAGTEYTLQASDNGVTLYFTNAAAITLNVPNGLGAGFDCGVVQGGAGQVTVTAVGTTINSRQGYSKTAGQYAYIALLAVAADFFVFTGDGA